jgi:hypothetical protein
VSGIARKEARDTGCEDAARLPHDLPSPELVGKKT